VKLGIPQYHSGEDPEGTTQPTSASAARSKKSSCTSATPTADMDLFDRKLLPWLLEYNTVRPHQILGW
jgi:hypothetical protein